MTGLSSLAAYLTTVYFYPALPVLIWQRFDEIISSLNIFSLLFCCFLLFKGHYFPELEEGNKSAPLPYQERSLSSSLGPAAVCFHCKNENTPLYNLTEPK